MCVCVCVCVCAASLTTVVCQSTKVMLLLKQAKTVVSLKTVITMGSKFTDEEKSLAKDIRISLYTFEEVMVRGRVSQ